MPAQRVFLVFQAAEVFINGLEPNILDSFRLPSSFFEICLKCALATVFLTGNGAERTQMTLLICKLFLNANKHMCSSLKSVKIATSAVGVRRRTFLFRSQISHGQAEGRLPFLNGDMHTVVSNYFDWRLFGWKSITS